MRTTLDAGQMPTPDWLPLTSWNMRKIGLPPERISVNNLFRRYCDRRLNFSFFRNPFCEQYLTRAKIPAKPHPFRSVQAHCGEAKPDSGRGSDGFPLRFQSDCKSPRWIEPRSGGIGEEPILPAHYKGLYAALGTVVGEIQLAVFRG